MSTRDYPARRGPAAIGARLRRLSDRIDREAERIYAEMGVEFEQRWFGVLNQLTLRGSRSVGDIAAELGVTHAAVSQVRGALERRGLVGVRADPSDGRRTLLVMTPAGRRLAERLRPVWVALEAASCELDEEAEGVVATLDKLEQAINRKGLAARVRGALRK
ncbi:MAG: MarR family transcriptional regulator [Hyphomonadaceae bacterium]|nr:MarR family transcriptional regulator [Hyphomonadaceae bacterium]